MGILLAPGDGVDGIAIMEFPPFGPPASVVDPAKAQQAQATSQRDRAAWDSVMASLTAHWPGQYMFLPVASSLEVNGQYSTWLPGPGGAWSRARKTDNFHLCPTGAAALGQATLTQLTPVLNLPPPAASWWSGSWDEELDVQRPARVLSQRSPLDRTRHWPGSGPERRLYPGSEQHGRVPDAREAVDGMTAPLPDVDSLFGAAAGPPSNPPRAGGRFPGPRHASSATSWPRSRFWWSRSC